MSEAQIGSIQPIWSVFPTDTQKAIEKEPIDPTGMFGAIFQTAIDNVKVTDADKNETEYLLATGQLDNPADMTIASTKAQMSVELLIQLRNKALEAYNELMRISL